MKMFISGGCYLLALLLSMRLASVQYWQMLRRNEANGIDAQPPVETGYRLTLTSMVMIVLLFALCNLVATQLSVSLGGDRLNYTLNYQGIRDSSSAGLMFVIHALKRFTANVHDDYLILSIVLSFIYISSVHNSWINRLAYFLYLPVAAFFSEIAAQDEDISNSQLIHVAVMGVNALLTLRFFVLLYSRYGGFSG